MIRGFVRIGVIDSGVHAAHPHVGGVEDGVAFMPDGQAHHDYVDRLGHGTAVTAAIREKAPRAAIYAIKVFDRTLATSVAALVQAIDWAIAERLHVINLSLGTTNPAHETAMRDAVRRADAAGICIVSAHTSDQRWLPGSLSLPRVIGVDVDWDCPREAYAVAPSPTRDAFGRRGHDGVHRVGGPAPDDPAAPAWFRASGYPRDIPGVPRERNLKGVSFAVANMTGFVARALADLPSSASFADLVRHLRTHARGAA